MVTHTKPYERYYADISIEEAKEPLELMQPMAYSAFTTPTQYAGWKDYGIPCTYIKCLKDNAVTERLWEPYLALMREAGVDLTVEEMDIGHSPFWIAPKDLADLLARVIG
jgi:hypothetical protein